MAESVVSGKKTDITKKYPGLNEILIEFDWQTSLNNMEIDTAAFMIQENGKCRNDEDFIFYGNPQESKGAVILEPKTNNKSQVKMKFSAMPPEIKKIALTMTIYEGPQRGHNFGQVSQISLKILNNNREELIIYNLTGQLQTETAIVVGEIYSYNNEWKFNPIGKGYTGGLAALCGSFGIVVSDSPSEGIPLSQPALDKAPAPPAPAVPPAGKVNLSKIELKKRGDKVNLEKKDNSRLGEILINLNWSRNKKNSGGFLGSLFNKEVDLDLGCLIEMSNGQKGVIQALGNSFGSFNSFPYIALDGDDRTGDNAAGENLRINGDYISKFKRILVFAYIYSGVAAWSQADAVVTVKYPGGADIVVQLDEHDNKKIMCGIVMFENVDNKTFSVERVVQYFTDHVDLDRAFGWGMNWKAGKK